MLWYEHRRCKTKGQRKLTNWSLFDWVINNWTNPLLHGHLIRHCVGIGTLQVNLIVVQLEIPSPPPSASLILYSSSWDEWSRPSRTSLSFSLYVSFSNLLLVWLTYLHAWSPDPALQRYHNDRYVVVVSPAVAMWYLDQFVEVHSCNHKACRKKNKISDWSELINPLWPSRSSTVTAQTRTLWLQRTCFVCSSEKNFLHQMLGRVALRGCCDEHLNLSDRLLVGEILVEPVWR